MIHQLPNGVVLRDLHDPKAVRNLIYDGVRDQFLKRFPIENEKIKIELLDAKYDERKKNFSLEDQEEALMTGGRLVTPLRGRVRLTDKVTGKPLDEKEVTLANVPHMTDDGTTIMGGIQYTTSNQSRLKPGLYARRKSNGELETHINTKPGTGPQMRLFMEPDTGIYRIQANKANIKLYPILHGLGVPDEKLRAAWGDLVLQANQKAFDKQAFTKLYGKLLRHRADPAATPEQQRLAIAEQLNRAELDPEVNQRNLGKPHTNLTTDALVDSSAKLLRINRGEDQEDDRDNPANRTFHSIDDFMGERVRRDAGALGRTLLYKATYDRSLKHLRPGYFTPQLEGLIVGNQLSQPVPGINPVEIYDQHKRVIQLGEGGVSSMESIPMSSRSVHPGQLGLIDPIRSSESQAIGVDQRFSIAAKKGSDNHIYFPVRNRKTGSIEYMNPVQLHGKVLGFPEAPSLAGYHSPSVLAPDGTTITQPKLAEVAQDQVPLDLLREIKAHSDRGNYPQKAHMLRQLMQQTPRDWEVEQEGPVVGVVHRPTGFQYHLPRAQVPASFFVATGTKAADLLKVGDAVPAKIRPNPASDIRPISAMRSGKLSYAMPHEVDYEMVSPSHMFTDTSHLIPMSSAMKGARLFIASKYQTQALPLQNPESPLIDTIDEDTGHSFSRTLGNRLGVKKSPADGIVEKVSNRFVTIRDVEGKEHRQDLKWYHPSNRKTYTTESPMVEIGMKVKAGDPIARSNYTDKEGRLAMGRNLHVAFMPAREGASFEDAIEVSSEAAKKLTSTHLYGYDIEHRNGVESDKERFIRLFPNKYTNDQLKKIEPNGMARKGAHLEAGDPMMLSFAPRMLSSKDSALGNLHKVLRNSHQDFSQTWEKSTPGIVTHSVQHRTGMKLNVATAMPLVAGDKISARSGAKGVISKVTPSEHMHRTADGRPIDVIINPAALIGRVNPAMIFEALLGKVAHAKGHTYRLPAFGQESYRDFVEHELKKHGVSDREDLEDPHSGLKVSVLTGQQYFQKLEHTSESKISGRGDGGQDINEQPTKGGDEGSKRLGGLQMLALLSHGVPAVIRDAQLYRGSGNPEMWRRLKLGQSLPEPKTPFIYDKFISSLKAGGINVRQDGRRQHLLAMTDRDVDAIAPHEVQSSETIHHKTTEPIKGGLMDFSLHGGPEGRGWSHIKLDHAIPNPVMEEPVRRLLGITEKQLREVVAGRAGIGGRQGPDALEQHLGGLNLDHLEQHARETIRTGRRTKRDEAVRQLGFIEGLKRSGLTPQDLMVRKVPVLPPAFRPVVKMGDMLLTSDANYLYKDLMMAREAHRKNKADLPESELGDEKLAIYDALKAVQGLGDPINVETAAKGVKGFIRQVAGVGGPKTGMFMSKVVGHPVNAVGRGVIVPDSNLNMDQVGIPEDMAWPAFGPFTMRSMVKAGMPAMEAARHVEERTKHARQHLQEAMKNPVMYSRDPALHRFSIMGGMPVLVAGNNIRLSPLVVNPFGADFDGDQMNIHVPITDDARREVMEKMLPSHNLFGLKGKKVHYLPTQEMILGLHNSTLPNTKLRPIRFSTREEALKAYRDKLIPVDQPIEIEADERAVKR